MSGPELEPHPSASPSASPARKSPAWNSSPIWRSLPPSTSATTIWKTAYSILTGDLLSPPDGLPPSSFDRVMSNPPFQKAGTHTPPPGASRALAHGEGSADLAAWVAFCTRMLKPRGTLTLIHRADRLDDLIALLHGRFGAITLIPLLA